MTMVAPASGTFQPVDLQRNARDLIFMCVFFLILIGTLIWWLKR